MSPHTLRAKSNIDEGAKEMLSRQLAAIIIAIMNIKGEIDSTIAAVDPANVTWHDVARLHEIVQMLPSANLSD